jgi:hypothetical protein
MSAKEVHPIYLNYEYVEGTAEQIIYATANVQTLQPVNMMEKASDQYIINTTDVPYNHTVSNVNKETTVGQLLAQGSGDTDIAHTSITTKTDNMQTVTADVNEVAYTVPIITAINHSSLNRRERSELSLTATNTMGPFKWLLQNFEIAQGVSIPRTPERIQLLEGVQQQ